MVQWVLNGFELSGFEGFVLSEGKLELFMIVFIWLDIIFFDVYCYVFNYSY